MCLIRGDRVSLNDSQDDSQLSAHGQTKADDPGIGCRTTELKRTSTNVVGWQTRGLQNRLRGAVEASWVGSIPIHLRHRQTP